MIDTLVYYLYKYLIVPLAYLLLQVLRPFVSGKLKEMIEDKNHGFCKIHSAKSAETLAQESPLWIHSASGEIEYARPVIREFKKAHPDIPVLVTFSSPSAKAILRNLSDVDAWAALPWDFEKSLNKFISNWNPRVLLFSRTDVWPVLAETARQRKIPSILFSATFADNSSRLRGLTRFLTRKSLNALSQIHCVAHEDVANLHALQVRTPIYVTGDTRFDQVFHRLQNPKALKNELIATPEDFVFIAGSTWPEDEAVLIPALAHSKTTGIRTILAPHEVSAQHLKALTDQLEAASLSYVLYSQVQEWPRNSILIIDQVGILAELYTWANLAFIGGSFKKQVHSVMEALAAGLPVMVGPHHQNNREALFYQKKNFSSGMIVQVVHSSEDVLVLLQRMKKQHFRWPQVKEEIRLEVSKNKNSTHRILAAVQEIAPPS